MASSGSEENHSGLDSGEQRYLPEIDGLRAVAVVCVILYHSKISAFANGYLGVDIFFVISGFVITRLIVNKGAGFSFKEFYGRRIRRLAPSLFLVLAVTEIISVIMLYPTELRRVLSSLLYISFFAGNVYFLRTSNYFNDSNFNPLLHTWSLGVEEQFYLFLPILLFLLLRHVKRRSGILVIIFLAILASLLVAQYSKGVSQPFSFYMLPTRAWELLLGTGAALIVHYWRKNGRLLPHIFFDVTMAMLGISMIIFSLFGVSGSAVFPDLSSILVCVGVFLLLLSSQPLSLYRLLSNHFLVIIGKRSYTAYLWHFPILGFFEYKLGPQLNFLQLIYCYYVLILVTELVFRFIEIPIRKKNWSFGKSLKLLAGFTTILVASSTYLLVFPIGAGTVGSNRLLLQRFPDKIHIDRTGSCYINLGQRFADFPASCDPSEKSTSLVIMGDSHAAVIAEGLRKSFKSVGEYTSSLCPPFVNVVRLDRPNCKEANDSAFAHIERLQPDRIILSANWWAYVALGYTDEEMTQYLGASLDYIRSISPQSKVYVLGGLPLWLPSLPDLILKSDIRFESGAKIHNVDLARIRKYDQLVEAVAQAKGANFLSIIAHLCDDNDQCTALTTNADGQVEPYVYDASHLTPSGSLDLIKRFRASGQL